MTKDSTCYLAGAGEDISFDTILVRQFGCRVRIIDPTPRAIKHFEALSEAVAAGRPFSVNGSTSEFYHVSPSDLERMSFLPIGLAGLDQEMKFYFPKDPQHVSCSTANLQRTSEFFTAQCHRLSAIMKQQGDYKIDLLKIDIEGAEYEVIRDITDSGVPPRLLLVEFDEAHSPLDAQASSRIAASVKQLLDAGMHCVAIDGSNLTFVLDR
ncbi:MAG TPA: FkbM family methyltransferase [Castellaniella sp.]|uniref:FkbM family methyltransferase n=1 Tax=Castellaniella sp. TaxID=1955812 RepID=UPI002EF3AD5B